MKTRVIPSAMPIYMAALVWALGAFVLPLYTLWGIALCAVLSAAVYFLSRRFFPSRTVEEEIAPDSGDEEVNRQIAEGREFLKSLKDAYAEFFSQYADGICAPLERMIDAGEKIFAELEKNPKDSQQVRKFMNYYLPTSVKLIEHYRTMNNAGSGENVAKSKESIQSSLGMIASAFEKQLDRLYADDQLDIYAEIRALETMMSADGLTEGSASMPKGRS